MSTEDKGPTNKDSAEEGENQARGLRPTGLYEVDESRFLGRTSSEDFLHKNRSTSSSARGGECKIV